MLGRLGTGSVHAGDREFTCNVDLLNKVCGHYEELGLFILLYIARQSDELAWRTEPGNDLCDSLAARHPESISALELGCHIAIPYAHYRRLGEFLPRNHKLEQVGVKRSG